VLRQSHLTRSYARESRTPDSADTVKKYMHFECSTDEFLERAIRCHGRIESITGIQLLLDSYPGCMADLRVATAGSPHEVQAHTGSPQ
jgi:hypothetical protein